MAASDTQNARAEAPAVEPRRLLPIYFRSEQQHILAMEARGLREGVDFVIHGPGPTPEGSPERGDRPRPAETSIVGPVDGMNERHPEGPYFRMVITHKDDTKRHCSLLSRGEAEALRDDLNALLGASSAPAPSAVPERAAGGGGLPGVEELDRYEELATWLFEWKYPSKPYADMMRVSSPDVRENWLKVARNTAPTFAAILARLAQPRPAAAGEGDAAPGRIDAGAVRVVEECLRDCTQWDPECPHARRALDQIAALDRAGEGSAPKPKTVAEIQAEISRLQHELHWCVCGDPSKGVTITVGNSTSTEPSP